MITKFMVTGDCHQDFSRFANYERSFQHDPNAAVIILGDAGFNFWLDERDDYVKDWFTKKFSFYVYCVRGNHEARPQDVPGMMTMYDDNVQGIVYYQPRWPRIRYFQDVGTYFIDRFSVGVIGGAYSVDKFYRLARHAPWFENEQLSEKEQLEAFKEFPVGCHRDFMFTHTCPLAWEPTDLFLGGIDQSKVDKSMEIFLDNLQQSIDVGVWCFGHYHADRLERPRVEQLYKDSDDIRAIWNRWHDKKTIKQEWWLVKSPNYYINQGDC